MVLSIVPKAQGEGQEGGSQQEKVTREKIQVLVKYKGETCDLHHHLSPVTCLLRPDQCQTFKKICQGPRDRPFT